MLVKLGLGIEIMAPWTVRAEIKLKKLVALPLLRGWVRRQWVLAQLKDKPLTLVERAFRGLVS
ncbi:MAG: hypothetical protein K8R87_00205 [Verrucomicrobia bacterium]|nr:hypothetical protein [Verrucomicrobiota bacterium]